MVGKLECSAVNDGYVLDGTTVIGEPRVVSRVCQCALSRGFPLSLKTDYATERTTRFVASPHSSPLDYLCSTTLPVSRTPSLVLVLSLALINQSPFPQDNVCSAAAVANVQNCVCNHGYSGTLGHQILARQNFSFSDMWDVVVCV